MATPVNMPQVGQDLESARIIEWHVKEGDLVKESDIIATVESDKASFEVEALAEGTILKLLFDEGEDGYVFKPIAYIGEPGESIPGQEEVESLPELNEDDFEPEAKDIFVEEIKNESKIFSSPSARRLAKEHLIDINDVEPTGPGNRLIKRDILAYAATIKQVKATPVARQVARSEGIRLNELNGTGPMGRIHKSDVLNAAKRNTISAAAGDEDEVEQFDKVRKIIADRLSLSKQTIPHYYLNIDVEVENALKLKDKLKKEPGVKVSFNDILVQAVARVLRRYKRLNSHVDYEKIVIKKTMNIGIAVSTEAGLYVPVLAHTDKKTLAEISKEIRKLADDARRGIVNPANQATFTISNLGMYGISGFQAIINPPECAILSVGAIEKRVIPSENGIKIADMVNIGLAVDHRAVDGAYAAQFLNELKTELTNINI